MNTFGNIFTLTSFGESHGSAVGGVIDGCPAGIELDLVFIQNELNRRRPGQSKITTPRNEADEVHFLSGIFEGKTTGSPIGFVIWNANHHSSDYDNMRELYRPSHADYTYQQKYGIRDHRGGGRSSARETISRCVAGAIAKLILKQLNIEVTAYTSQVGSVRLEQNYESYDLSLIENTPVRCPDMQKAAEMIALIEDVKSTGDTIGGVVTCVIKGTPVGLGEPVFGKLHAALGSAMLSINAVKGFEYGDGFDVNHKGSEVNDVFQKKAIKYLQKRIIQEEYREVYQMVRIFISRLLSKPVATILMQQSTVNFDGEETSLKARGRHDACVLPRAVPIVEAMAAMTILDYYLLNKASL